LNPEEDLSDEALYGMLDAYRTKTSDPRLEGLTRENMVRRSFHMRVNDVNASYGVGDWGRVNDVPFYSRVRRYEDRIEILYVLSFAFNGAFQVCCSPVGAHSADIEHVTLRVSLDGQRVDWVYFGAHGMADGVWRRADQLALLPSDRPWGTRPQVYSSRHSHGLYPEAGTWCRICGFANDVTSGPAADGRNAWDPAVPAVLLLDPLDRRFDGKAQGGTKWLAYPGTLGEDGIDAIRGQGFWARENPYQNNCFRRGLWPCRYIDCNWPTDDCCYNMCQKKVDFASYSSVPAAATLGPPPPTQTPMER